MNDRVRFNFFMRRQVMPTWLSGVRLAAHAGCLSLLFACSVNLFSMPVLLPASAAETSPAATPAAEATSEQSSGAQPGTDQSKTEQTSTDAKQRQTLKGSTQVIEYKLSNLASYREGMSALDRRNFSVAEALFKAAAAQLDEGYDKYRAECLFFQGKSLVGMGKGSEAANVFKAAVKLFEQHDPNNPYRAVAVKQVAELTSGKAKMDTATLHSGGAMQSARISVDQHITLAAGVTRSDTKPLLLRVDKDSISKTVYKCFADMTCLETAEIGSNINNAVGRWQPLLVEESPAAFNLGSSNPVINVKMSGVIYKINLPTFRGLKRILLATDGEKICAMDLDNNDSWLLRLKKNKDNSLQGGTWAKLTHVKDRSNSTVGARDSRPSRTSILDTKTNGRSVWENTSGRNSGTASGWEGSGASGWESKPKRKSGWSSRSSGSSGWSNSFSGSSWGSKESSSPSWATSGAGSSTGNSTSGFDSEQSRRHFSKERRGRSRSSGF